MLMGLQVAGHHRATPQQDVPLSNNNYESVWTQGYGIILFAGKMEEMTDIFTM